MELTRNSAESAGYVNTGHLVSTCAEKDSSSETYRIDRVHKRVVRTVLVAKEDRHSYVPLLDGAPNDPHSAFDWCWLRQRGLPKQCNDPDPVRIVDMFSGCGQMSLGVSEACRALGRRGDLVLAIDTNPAALQVCRRLFDEVMTESDPAEEVFGGKLKKPFTKREENIRSELGKVDFLVGGPPCQGHSNLNNRSRRDDERNSLGFRMVRAAQLLQPRHVVIENVLGIKHDRGRVFGRMKRGLTRLGYRVTEGVIRAEELGVAQRRHRTFLVGTLSPHVDLASVLASAEIGPRPFSWACGDLEDKCDVLMNRHPVPKPQNQRRIKYLFEKDLYDLPDAQRPRCHQNGTAYTSSYGRMSWEHPTQTITTTFQCIGTGRFVHPRRPRPITLREAARLQSIPDYVDFSGLSGTAIAHLIGNAVPPKVTYTIAMRLLRGSLVII